MQFNLALLTTALIAAASPAMSATITFFDGANCAGQNLGSHTIGAGTCLTLDKQSVRSIRYSGVPSRIAFYESGGTHDNCKGDPQATFGSGSGCSTAPDGFNWESVLVN